MGSSDLTPDLLSTPAAGGRVVRGGVVRGIGYGVGTLFAAGTSVFLLRYLGRDDFGRYGAVAALLGVISGISDAGLTAVGSRELALASAAERPRVLRNLVSLRLVITPIGILAAAVFAFVAYDQTMFWGTILGGIGVLLINTQATMMMPLSIDLRLGTIALFEATKTALTFFVVAVLVAMSASLLAIFGTQIVVGAVVVLLTPLVVPVRRGLLPGFDRSLAGTLVREALPLALALTMNVVYFRVLMIMVSLLASPSDTGLFATSFQVFAVLFTLPLLVLSSALPLLAVAGRDDDERLRFGLQKMTEVAFLVSIVFVLTIVALAPVGIPLIGGAQYEGAVPVLQIQAFALIAVFVGQVGQLALLALRRQAALVWANAGALVVVVVLGALAIPLWGATGAAVVTVVGEAVLAMIVLVLLHRAAPRVAPRPGLVPRAAIAAAGGCAVLLLDIPWELQLVLSLAVFGAAAAALRAVPFELMHALRGR